MLCRREEKNGKMVLEFYEDKVMGKFEMLPHKQGIYRLSDIRFLRELPAENKEHIWQNFCEELDKTEIKILLDCRVAQNWFADHPEQKHLLANVKAKPGF